MRVERVSDVKTEPVSLGEVRRQARIDDTASDDAIRIYIEAARNHVEHLTQNALVESTYIFYFDTLEDAYTIYNPIVSITSFEYKNADNTGTYSGSLTGSDYHFNSSQGLITLSDNAMSDINEQSNAVKITAVCGNENIGLIKGDIKLAMLLMISHWHENRENSSVVQLNEIPIGAKDLIAPYRCFSM